MGPIRFPLAGLAAGISLLTTGASAQTPDARDILMRSDDALLHASTVRMKAVEDLDMSMNGAEVKIAMHFELSMGTGKRFHYQVNVGDIEKLMVSDGKTTWTYLPKTNAYTVATGSSPAPAQDMQNIFYGRVAANITRAEVLRTESISIDTRSMDCFVIRAEYSHVAGLPNSTAAVRTVWIDRDSGLIWRDIWEGEQKVGNPPVSSHVRIAFNYSLLELGAPLADDLFAFQPPEGARLVKSFTPPGVVGGPNLPSAGMPNYGDPLGKLEPPDTRSGSNASVVMPPLRPGVYRAGNGVTKPVLLSKAEPLYSEEARKAGIQGVVILYIEVGANGQVQNPKVVKSLGHGLDDQAIEAVKQWKFQPGEKDGAPVAVAATIDVNFRLFSSAWIVTKTEIAAQESGQKATIESMPANRSCAPAGTVALYLKVNADGQVIDARALNAPNALANIAAISFAKTLRFKPPSANGSSLETEGEIDIDCPAVPQGPLPGILGGIASAGPPPPAPKQIASISQSEVPPGGVAPPPPQITVGGAVQAAKLLQKTEPQYPQVAREARVSGTVRLRAIIAKDGTVKELSVIDGHALLREAAMDAVKTWKYAPTVLNGQPVEVITEIAVTFTLDK